MKTTFFKGIIAGLFAVFFTLASYAGNVENESKSVNAAINVLVVGLDHVSSNYFPESMITDETGIPKDSISETYNRIIIHNIIQANKNKKFRFVSSKDLNGVDNLVSEIKLSGEEEDTYADLSQIKTEDYNKLYCCPVKLSVKLKIRLILLTRYQPFWLSLGFQQINNNHEQR